MQLFLFTNCKNNNGNSINNSDGIQLVTIKLQKNTYTRWTRHTSKIIKLKL